MTIKLSIVFFTLHFISLSESIIKNLDLGDEIKITQKYFNDLEDEIIINNSFLKVLERTPNNYKYLYFDEFGVSFITKDTIKKFIYFNGNFYSNRNYFNDFDKPLSSYIHFIELGKSIESLTVGIENQTISASETDSSFYYTQKIYLEDLNLNRSLSIEWSKNNHDFLKITKTASQNGVNLPDMWEEVNFFPSGGVDCMFDLDNMFSSFNKNFEPNENFDSLSTLDTVNGKYLFKGINKLDTELALLLKENKYLLVYSWGIWCGPCRLNKNNISKLYKNLDDKFNFISVNCEKNQEYTTQELLDYISKKDINYPVFYGCDFLEYFNSLEYPNLLVFNDKLELIGNYSGFVKNVIIYEEFLNQFD